MKGQQLGITLGVRIDKSMNHNSNFRIWLKGKRKNKHSSGIQTDQMITSTRCYGIEKMQRTQTSYTDPYTDMSGTMWWVWAPCLMCGTHVHRTVLDTFLSESVHELYVSSIAPCKIECNLKNSLSRRTEGKRPKLKEQTLITPKRQNHRKPKIYYYLHIFHSCN